MKSHWYLPGIVLVVATTIVSGVVQGRMRNRWGPSPDTLSAAHKLAETPTQFGDWRLQSSGELGETASRMLECAGYLVRSYENQATGDVVGVTLLLGPPGPISVHTPEICYGSRNYQSRSERQRMAIRRADGQDDEFWALDYKANDLRGDLLRVYYAWSTGDRWSAAKDARFVYASQPYLYKIQLFSRLLPGTNAQSHDPCQMFLQDFLPVARKCLVEPSTN
jgi:hypothetical protein